MIRLKYHKEEVLAKVVFNDDFEDVFIENAVFAETGEYLEEYECEYLRNYNLSYLKVLHEEYYE
jgi:hypothetical protein